MLIIKTLSAEGGWRAEPAGAHPHEGQVYPPVPIIPGPSESDPLPIL